jgi:hypothetical protein
MVTPSLMKYEKMLEVGVSPQAVLNSMSLDKKMTLQLIHEFFKGKNLLNQVAIPASLPEPIVKPEQFYETMLKVGVPAGAVSLRKELDSH